MRGAGRLGIVKPDGCGKRVHRYLGVGVFWRNNGNGYNLIDGECTGVKTISEL
jgi:hypothetical protein